MKTLGEIEAGDVAILQTKRSPRSPFRDRGLKDFDQRSQLALWLSALDQRCLCPDLLVGDDSLTVDNDGVVDLNGTAGSNHVLDLKVAVGQEVAPATSCFPATAR